MNPMIENKYDDLEDIQSKLINFSIDNVKWSCIFSGMGIITPLEEKENNHIIKMGNSNTSKQSLSYYVPLQCIYEKGNSTFKDPPPEILNPSMYMWDFSSFNKNISIEAQAYAILNLCTIAELMYRENIIEGYLMIKTAKMFYNFISTYLRNEDGLFISGQDKTKNFEKKLKIKTTNDNPSLYDQVVIVEAILKLYRLTSNTTLKEYYSSKASNYLSEGISLFNYLYDNYELFYNLNSKELALCISAFSRCIPQTAEEELNEKLNFLIANLTAELETRVCITGEVVRNQEDSSISSLITHFRTSSALIEGFSHTNIYKFEENAKLINLSLLDLYDSSIGLFLTGNQKSINYSIGDIAEIIKFYVLSKMILKDSTAFVSLKEFYHYSIERTSIIQAVVSSTNDLNEFEANLNENIPPMETINKAPIFLKYFKLKYRKKAIEFETSKYFCSVNGLYASYIFLYYLNLKITNN